jgi:cysteine synthase
MIGHDPTTTYKAAVIGAGSGGTLAGISRKLKQKDPNIKIIGIDEENSVDYLLK